MSDKPANNDSEPPRQGPGWADVGIGALNGVVGDYLQGRGNALAQQLRVYDKNQPVEIDRETIAKTYPDATNRVCVFAHGLCCTENTWSYPDEPDRTYGTQLRDAFGMTPVYVRYNTGLHISENGRAYCQLLDQLLANWPVEVEDLTLVGHSMGGLMSRSACLYADRLESSWIRALRRAVYLGSPHLGAPLEKVGNVAAAVFGAIPDPVTRLVRDLINTRSIGIKDLRYANLVDEDWIGRNPDAVLVDSRTDTPLRASVDHYVAVGTLTRQENHVLALMIGDGLVRVPSGTGNANVKGQLELPAGNVARFPGLHHMQLGHHPDVYAQIETWLNAEES